MTGRPAALSALALASTASVADSEIADTRAETLLGMGSIVPSADRAERAVFGGRLFGVTRGGAAVRLGGLMDVHCMDRQPSCRCGSMPVCVQRCVMSTGMCCEAVLLRSKQRAVAQLARVPVSKTGGWGFESLLPCEHSPSARRPSVSMSDRSVLFR